MSAFPSPRHRTELLGRLRTLGIQLVTVSFAGSGDSGSVEDVTCTDAQGKSVSLGNEKMPWPTHSSHFDKDKNAWVQEVKDESKALGDILEQVTYDALEEQGIDWYNNEGGQGSLEIDFSYSPPDIQVNCEVNVVSTEDCSFNITEEIEAFDE